MLVSPVSVKGKSDYRRPVTWPGNGFRSQAGRHPGKDVTEKTERNHGFSVASSKSTNFFLKKKFLNPCK